MLYYYYERSGNMPEAMVSRTNHKENGVTRRLKISDYILEIRGKDIINIELTYSISNRTVITYKDGKKDRVEELPTLTLELYGNDSDGNPAGIEFMLDTDIEYLNTLSKIPTDITDILSDDEAFIKRPNHESPEFLDFYKPRNHEDDIFKYLSSLWISKIKDNEFILKLCVGYEVFTYFKLVIE